MEEPDATAVSRRAPEVRRRKVVDAARRMFLTQGYERTRVEQVAEAAGVSVGLVYKQHPTKAHLLQAVRDDFEDRFLAALDDAQINGAPPRQRFGPIVSALFDTAAGSPELQGMLDLPPAAPGTAPRRLHARIAALIAEGVSAGHYRPVDPAAAAVIAYGMVDAALRQSLASAGEEAERLKLLLVDAWARWLVEDR